VSSFTERLFKTVGRHVVSLSCVQRLPETNQENILVFSGFLVKVGDAWFFVTSGHILRDIRKAIYSGVEFDVWRIDDQTAGNKFRGIAIPYAFDIDQWHVIYDEEIGLDYAAVTLNPLYCQQLEAGNAMPIGKMAWGDQFAEHDHWVLIGIPSETVRYDQETIITGRTVMIPLDRTEKPENVGHKAENKFYAHLKNMGDVKNIEGMSGGPLFAIKKIKGEWKYKVIGVQSSWYRSIRIIAACPFASLGSVLEEFV